LPEVMSAAGVDFGPGAAPVAVVTAGWREREDEDRDLVEALLGNVINLRLYARAGEVFAADPELAAAHAARGERLQALQDVYELRLGHAVDAVYDVAGRTGWDHPEVDDAFAHLRALDQRLLAANAEVLAEFEDRWCPGQRDMVAHHRAEVGAALAAAGALAIAGGQVPTLLNRLRLFGVVDHVAHLPVFAWSAGAMVATDRIVVFHDDPPHGHPHARVFERGLGWAQGVVALPHARRRLRVDDHERMAVLARRFAPATCQFQDDATTGSGVAGDHGRAQTTENRGAAAGGGGRTTFVFNGAADAVRLRHWVFGLAASPAFSRVRGTDEWHLTLDLPGDSRIEYKLEVERGGHTELIEDPANPNRARDPFGANSVLYTAGYEPPEWTRPDPQARPGTIERFRRHSPALGREVDVAVYLPARMLATRSYPLLIVHDGNDYLEYSAMQTVLDNLIDRHELASLVVAFSNPAERLVEYGDDPRHARHVVDELVPWMEAAYPIRRGPAARGIMGASFGAVAAFSVAHRHPGRFGRVLLQSGSFAFADIGQSNRGPVFAPVERMINAYREQPTAFTEEIFVSCGRYESLIYENRSLVPVLQSTGMDVRYVEARDGHNWENWRDRLRDALTWLFPGPLWMVYE
jgi:enterochelin esterase family protein